jgi:hypothetical protein
MQRGVQSGLQGVLLGFAGFGVGLGIPSGPVIMAVVAVQVEFEIAA